MKKHTIFNAHSEITSEVVNKYTSRSSRNTVRRNLFDEIAVDNNVKYRVVSARVDERYTPEKAIKRALETTEVFRREIESSKKSHLITSGKDFQQIGENQLGLILGLNSMKPLERNPHLIDSFYNLGVRTISLTYPHQDLVNNNPSFPDKKTDYAQNGLSEKELDILNRISDLGIIVDVSHSSYNAFCDIIRCYDGQMPLIASHSNSYKLNDARHNLRDDQLKSISNTGGVIGVFQKSDCFVNKNKPTKNNFIEHIKHMLEVVGIEHIGLGFDCVRKSLKSHTGNDMSESQGLESVVDDFESLGMLLKTEGFSENEVDKICKDNFVQVFSNSL